jgi:hypothetical protein
MLFWIGVIWVVSIPLVIYLVYDACKDEDEDEEECKWTNWD